MRPNRGNTFSSKNNWCSVHYLCKVVIVCDARFGHKQIATFLSIITVCYVHRTTLCYLCICVLVCDFGPCGPRPRVPESHTIAHCHICHIQLSACFSSSLNVIAWKPCKHILLFYVPFLLPLLTDTNCRCLLQSDHSTLNLFKYRDVSNWLFFIFFSRTKWFLLLVYCQLCLPAVATEILKVL